MLAGLCLFNVPVHLTAENIIELLSQYGALSKISILVGEHNEFRKIVYAIFSSEHETKKAAENLHGMIIGHDMLFSKCTKFPYFVQSAMLENEEDIIYVKNPEKQDIQTNTYTPFVNDSDNSFTAGYKNFDYYTRYRRCYIPHPRNSY